MSAGLAGHVASTGESLNIPDAYEDPRFNKVWPFFFVEAGVDLEVVFCEGREEQR